MAPEDVSELIHRTVCLTREDIARAKNWLISRKVRRVDPLVEEWMKEQDAHIPKEIQTDAPNCFDEIKSVSRAVSLRLAFFQAIWELLNSGDLIPAEAPTRWELSVGYKTSRGAGAIPNLETIASAYPPTIEKPQLAPVVSTDADIFLKGVDCKTLHDGIHEAIELALRCYRRGFYMPATAMLAAAAEATWTECANAVAKNLGDVTLQKHLADQPSFAKLVGDVRKALEPKTVRSLLEKAGKTIHDVNDAEVWTTTLRERRNALHWGKANSFVADHSETGTLLMAAPQHIGTLEAIRLAC